MGFREQQCNACVIDVFFTSLLHNRSGVEIKSYENRRNRNFDTLGRGVLHKLGTWAKCVTGERRMLKDDC